MGPPFDGDAYYIHLNGKTLLIKLHTDTLPQDRNHPPDLQKLRWLSRKPFDTTTTPSELLSWKLFKIFQLLTNPPPQDEDDDPPIFADNDHHPLSPGTDTPTPPSCQNGPTGGTTTDPYT
jgi:hypothetical protein